MCKKGFCALLLCMAMVMTVCHMAYATNSDEELEIYTPATEDMAVAVPTEDSTVGDVVVVEPNDTEAQVVAAIAEINAAENVDALKEVIYNNADILDLTYLLEDINSFSDQERVWHYVYVEINDRPVNDVAELRNVIYLAIDRMENTVNRPSGGTGGGGGGGPIDPDVPQIVIGSAEWIRPGSVISVDVELKNCTGFANLGIELHYDQNYMTLIDVKENTEVGGSFTPAETLDKMPFNMSWDGVSNNYFNGVMATLTFKVADNTPDGVYGLCLDYYMGRDRDWVDGESVNYDENEMPLNLAYGSGTIMVNNYLAGDINGDGRINHKDGTVLLRYFAGWDLPELVPPAVDVNGDGVKDNRDVTTLLRYLAGWNVEIY